jgi:hypothetical protein
MNGSTLRPAILAATLLTVFAGIGCQKKSIDAKATTVAAEPVTATPEESFAAIVEVFRRGVEDVPIGFALPDGSGNQSMMTGRNTVTPKLLPPAKDGEPFKAEIKVVSDIQYSLQRSSENSDAGKSDQAEDTGDDGSSTDDSDVQIFDPAVASAPGGAAERRPGSKIDPNAKIIAGTKNSFERIYHLVHEGGRWKLITELDPKTEELIKLAFERALESQS